MRVSHEPNTTGTDAAMNEHHSIPANKRNSGAAGIAGFVEDTTGHRLYVSETVNGHARIDGSGWSVCLDSDNAAAFASLLFHGVPVPDVEPPKEPRQAEQSQPTETADSGPTRKRGHISDLVDAGLLEPAAVLTFTYGGVTHEAIVHSDGRLDIDGNEGFDSPSKAAATVSGTAAQPGWDVWCCDDGRTLADLRWELRIATFEPYENVSEKYTAEVRRVIGRWLVYTRRNGLHPGRRDDDAVQRFLNNKPYAAKTLQSYTRHLDAWFATWDRTSKPAT